MDQPAYFKNGETEDTICLKAHCKSAADTARQKSKPSCL